MNPDEHKRPHREFGERLAAFRNLRRYTQEGLAEVTGIPVTTYRLYESGRTLPGAMRLHYLVEELEITTADLLDPRPEPQTEGIFVQ